MSDALSAAAVQAQIDAANAAAALGVLTDKATVAATRLQTTKALADYAKPAGALYETVPRWSYRGPDVQHTSGNIHSSAIFLPANLTISGIGYVTGATGGLTFTHQFFCLQNSNFDQLAVTADDLTAAWGASTPKPLPIATTAAGASTTFVTTYEGLYYLGYTVLATTMPFIQASTVPFFHASSTDLPLLAGTNGIGVGSPQPFPYNAGTLAALNVGLDYAYVY